MKRLGQLGFLARWPILSFVCLQIFAILLFDQPSTFTILSFGFVFLLLAISHFLLKRYLQFLILVSVVGLSFFCHHFQKQSLSPNIAAKKAQYLGVVQNEISSRDEVSRYKVILKKRVEPVPENIFGQIQLAVAGDCKFLPKSEILFEATVRSLGEYRNPGVFSLKNYHQRQNIWGSAFVENCELISVQKTLEPNFFSRLRLKFFQSFQNPEIRHEGILSALLLGTKTIDRPHYNKIKESGLSHLFVISGLHFGIMSLLIYAFFGKVFNFFPKLFLKFPKQKYVSALTLVCVVFYLGLINPTPSVVRAGLMISLYLVAVLFEKQKHLFQIVLMSLALILIFNPMDLFELGFQLSYLSILTLILILPKPLNWLSNLSWVQKRGPVTRFLIKLVAVTWVLNLVLTPMILFSFGSVSLNGLIQNLWAIPFFEFLVIPVGLFYMLTELLSLSMAPYILYFWDGTIQLFWLLQGYFESWSLPQIDTITPHALHLVIFYLGLFLIFRYYRKWLVALCLSTLFLSFGWTYYHNHLSYDLRITHFDVGQGDAVLVQTPEKNILIDTGGHPYRNLGETVLLPALKHMWVTQLDHIMITHGDTDHYKGLFGLIGRVKINEVWVNDLEPEDETYKSLLTTLANNKIVLKRKTQKEEIKWQDGTKVKVLSPNQKVASLKNKNDHSLVVKIEKDEFSALFTGDISEKAEKILVETYKDELKSDFLKVPHHGSSTSTSRLLLGYVKPKFASIGVKPDSPFGHPTSEVLDKLKEYDSQILRTDQDGQIQVSLKNKKVKVKTFAD